MNWGWNYKKKAKDSSDLWHTISLYDHALKLCKALRVFMEYAMLQNNLGNALQYLPSAHSVENNWRAIAAYDEALKVRNARDTPIEYANTIANKANDLCNLPDDPEHPAAGNDGNLLQARQYYQEARAIFRQYGRLEQAEVVEQVLGELFNHR